MMAGGAPVLGADAPPQPAQQQDVAQQDGQSDSGASGGLQPAAEQEAAGDTDQEQTTDGNSRFIPTEQISQDLGVSFPVDI